MTKEAFQKWKEKNDLLIESSLNAFPKNTHTLIMTMLECAHTAGFTNGVSFINESLSVPQSETDAADPATENNPQK